MSVLYSMYNVFNRHPLSIFVLQNPSVVEMFQFGQKQWSAEWPNDTATPRAELQARGRRIIQGKPEEKCD